MRKSALFFLLVTLLIGLVAPFLTNEGYAGDLNNTYIRLNRQVPATFVGGQVCSKTPSVDNGTENSVQIIFPNSFTVNSTASNWTVDTADIPDNALIWPGIDTANNVSGQTVTFPSGNLAANTLYCFNFASTNTLTTPSSTGSYSGTIQTKNSSNTTIDSIHFSLSIVNDDQISVTATVPASPTDFDNTLNLTSPANGTFPQDQTLEYKVTYGSSLASPANITVQAQWGYGTISGSGTPTVDLLDYVVGSATNGYGSTPAVIDISNKTISWTISSFPANTTGQTVSFQLKTNDSYTGSQNVSFTVSSNVLGPGATTADSNIASYYQYNYAFTPTSTPTPAPTNTPTPGPTATGTPAPTSTPTLTPTPAFKKFAFDSIDIRTVSSSQAAVFASSNNSSVKTLSYGTSTNNLNRTIIADNESIGHIFSLSGLSANTRYYFKVTAVDTNSIKLSSDLFSFETALPSTPPAIQKNSYIITSNSVLLSDELTLNASKNTQKSKEDKPDVRKTVIIPVNTPFSFNFKLEDSENVKQVRAIIRNKKVLGINTLSKAPDLEDSDSVSIIEITPGNYTGKLKSAKSPGIYELILQIKDYYGNIVEETLADINITAPMKILDTNGKGIENAKVTFYFYDQKLRIYQLLSSAITTVKNPGFSDTNGVVDVVLQQGRYKAEVEAIGFEKQTVLFTLAKDSVTFYPTLYLKRQPFNIVSAAKYYFTTINDVIGAVRELVHSLRTSFRFFELIAFMIASICIFLLWLSAANRFSVPFLLLPWFGLYHFLAVLRKTQNTFLIHGRVNDINSSMTLGGTLIYISSPSGKVITHTTTNLFGEFFARIKEAGNIRITVSKKGYNNYSAIVRKENLNKQIILGITPNNKPSHLSLKSLRWYINFGLDSLFESLLFIALIFEIVMGIEFGVLKVLPFVTLSILNVWLWSFHIKHVHTLSPNT